MDWIVWSFDYIKLLRILLGFKLQQSEELLIVQSTSRVLNRIPTIYIAGAHKGALAVRGDGLPNF